MNVASSMVVLLLIGVPLHPTTTLRCVDSKGIHKLQGAWKQTYFEHEGEDITNALDECIMLVKDGKYTLYQEEKRTDEGVITFDTKGHPKQYEFTGTLGGLKDKTFIGIYSLEDDTYKICIVPQGQKRPTDFTSTPGSKRDLIIWERITLPIIRADER